MFVVTWIGSAEEVMVPQADKLVFKKDIPKEVSKTQYCALMGLFDDLTPNPAKNAHPHLKGEIITNKKKGG